MNRTDKIIAISYPLILLAITIACTGALLSNYSSGKYSSEADSLIIPLSAIAITLLAQVFLYALQLPYYTHRPSQSGRGLVKKTVAIVATAISLTTFGWIIKFWSGATNLNIQLLYISAAIIFAGFQYRLYQKK
ncbi:hypothetical protein BLL42_02440 [Pseudomonas frederiksbergensis]|uniref:Lipoprotein n=1 Tax=Pseudomonas frederiksbergensis TaxID=104087 RepID=A0A1J0EEW3_9PSED|nr:hypothetical protein [Pseudomonas frederiksbergensis]APC14645.1 hypothetical protein BLL42_02440 [Pseudomonas frederiksbergensis]